MPIITYLAGGASTAIDAPERVSVMQTAILNDIAGIVAECGGNAMCATCHVYVEGGPQAALPAISVAEEEMLECTASTREPNSRLSCQILVSPELAGLVVRVADEQV